MTDTDPAAEDAFETLAVHAGAEPDELTGAVAPPIYQTSTFAQDGVNRPRRGYDYARSVNPTRDRLERAVAALERGRHGIAFSSGSAATAAIAQLAANGEEIVVGDDVYGGISSGSTDRPVRPPRPMPIWPRDPTSCGSA
jgi:cystathionine gamma-synthase